MPRLLPKPPSLSLMQAAQWMAGQFLKGTGFRLELRRTGELKLGLWRRTWKKRRRSSSVRSPRRLVLIPGFGDSPFSWLPVLTLLQPILRRQYDEIVLVDFPGFGGFLSRSRAYHSLDLMTEAVFDVLDSLKPHTLVGHSLGGWLSALYSARCGQGIRPRLKHRSYTGPESLLLLDSSGVYANEQMREEWDQAIEKMATSGAQAAMEIMRPHIFKREPLWFRLVEGEFRRFLSTEEIIQFMQSFKDEHLVTPILDQIRTRVWLLWGEHDTLTPASAAPVWLKGLTSCPEAPKAVILKNVGHSPQYENAPLLAMVLGQILAEKHPRYLEHPRTRGWWQIHSS